MLRQRKIRDRLVAMATPPIVVSAAAVGLLLVGPESRDRAGLVLAGLAVAATVWAVVVGWSVLRSLSTLAIAAGGLAEAQHRVGQGELRVDEIPTLAPPDPTDEIGRLAAAFDEVSRSGVGLADSQRQSIRKGLSTIVINLARRNQSLLDRQVEYLDALEQTEEDPDRLGELFRVDHLATRMRRNAESLLVLAGADPGKRKGKPVALSDVLRVAIGEVENYQQVELGQIEEGRVPAGVAVDLAHLTAELMENATQFSPPSSSVDVSALLDADAGLYRIRIRDRGMGLGDRIDQANITLADPPELGLGMGRSLGFMVVGRLAQRLRAVVRLESNEGGGTIAEVRLPLELLQDQRPPAPVAGAERAAARPVPGPTKQPDPTNTAPVASTTLEKLLGINHAPTAAEGAARTADLGPASVPPPGPAPSAPPAGSVPAAPALAAPSNPTGSVPSSPLPRLDPVPGSETGSEPMMDAAPMAPGPGATDGSSGQPHDDWATGSPLGDQPAPTDPTTALAATTAEAPTPPPMTSDAGWAPSSPPAGASATPDLADLRYTSVEAGHGDDRGQHPLAGAGADATGHLPPAGADATDPGWRPGPAEAPTRADDGSPSLAEIIGQPPAIAPPGEADPFATATPDSSAEIDRDRYADERVAAERDPFAGVGGLEANHDARPFATPALEAHRAEADWPPTTTDPADGPAPVPPPTAETPATVDPGRTGSEVAAADLDLPAPSAAGPAPFPIPGAPSGPPAWPLTNAPALPPADGTSPGPTTAEGMIPNWASEEADQRPRQPRPDPDPAPDPVGESATPSLDWPPPTVPPSQPAHLAEAVPSGSAFESGVASLLEPVDPANPPRPPVEAWPPANLPVTPPTATPGTPAPTDAAADPDQTAMPAPGSGLQKRQRGASKVPIGEGRPVAAPSRSPEEVRAMLSRYRDGLRNGGRRSATDRPGSPFEDSAPDEDR